MCVCVLVCVACVFSVNRCVCVCVLWCVCFTCLFRDTRCVSSWRRAKRPVSVVEDRAMMSSWARYMPLGGRRRARRGWCRYWAPRLSFLTRPEPRGTAELCFNTWGGGGTQSETHSPDTHARYTHQIHTHSSPLSWCRSQSHCHCQGRLPLLHRCYGDSRIKG